MMFCAALSLAVGGGCADAIDGDPLDAAAATPTVTSLDAALSAAAQPPSNDDLCTLVIGQSSFSDALGFLGIPSAVRPGSAVEYVYAPATLTLYFDPEELFEAGTFIGAPTPSCWNRREADFGQQRKRLTSFQQVAPTPNQVPADYPSLPTEAQLCTVTPGVTTLDEILFELPLSWKLGKLAELEIASLQRAVDYRFHDIVDDKIVSLYLFVSAADFRDEPKVDKIVAYNLTDFPSCWGPL